MTELHRKILDHIVENKEKLTFDPVDGEGRSYFVLGSIKVSMFNALYGNQDISMLVDPMIMYIQCRELRQC